MPPSVPVDHFLTAITNKMLQRPFPLFHARMFRRSACFEHSNFFKVNVPATQDTQLRASRENRMISPVDLVPPIRGPDQPDADPTTSFLTTTTLIYAIGAGITAAAGTRLALQ